MPRRSSHSKSPTPASASRRRSSASSSKRSSRPTPAPRASTAAPASALRSAAKSPACSAASSACKSARRAGQHVHAVPAAQLRRRRRARAHCRRSHAHRVIAPTACRAAPIEVIADDRATLDPRAADAARRRGRSRATRSCCAIWRARAGFKVAGRAARRRGAAASRGNTGRARSRSTSSCPTCSAGPCSRSSSRTRRRGTFRCRSSPSTRSAITASSAARLPILPKPATTESISEALERIRVYTLPRTKRLLVVEDDAGERLSIEELIRHDDVDDRHRVERRRGAREAAARRLRLRRARPAAARHERVRAARPHRDANRACVRCRSSCSPARI